MQPKRSLMRIVRNQDGVRVDPTGKASGRGAYLHLQKSCWQQALKGSLSKALKTDITIEELEDLKAFMTTLPEE